MILGTYLNLDLKNNVPVAFSQSYGGYLYLDVCRCGTNRGVPYPYPPKYIITSIGLVVGPLGCVLNIKYGDRIIVIVDLAAMQYSVFKYDRGYLVGIEQSTTPLVVSHGCRTILRFVSQVSRMITIFCDDANRVALATLEAAFGLVTEDLYTKMEDEATDMIWKVSEVESMADHREAFQSTRATLFSPEDCQWCHHPKVKKRCCGTVKYCGVVCQKKDRRMHRRVCTRN